MYPPRKWEKKQEQTNAVEESEGTAGKPLASASADHMKRFFSVQCRKRSNSKPTKAPKRRYVREERSYDHIVMAGVTIHLPAGLRPYPTQKLMMIRMLAALRDKTNALIESPTGSGKTMALLSSACAWLVKYKEERFNARMNCQRHGRIEALKSDTTTVDAILQGCDVTMTSCGAFVDEDGDTSSVVMLDGDETSRDESAWLGRSDDRSMMSVTEDGDDASLFASSGCGDVDENVCSSTEASRDGLADNKSPKSCDVTIRQASGEMSFTNDESPECTCLPRVTIYYGTRTHKQIAQVVKEYARLPYGDNEKLRHTILASREHSCINPIVRSSRTGGDITSQCRDLLSRDGPGCTYRNEYRKFENNAPRLRDFVEQSGGHRVWDMEDLVSTLSDAHPAICPYFAASRTLTIDADVVFCPFNYILDPIIRDSSDVRMRNSVFILDEAHNVEDICRDAASFEFQEKELTFCLENVTEKVSSILSLMQKLSSGDDSISLPVMKDADGQRLSMEEFMERLAKYHEALALITKFLTDLYGWLKRWAIKVLNSTASRSDGTYTNTSSWQELFDSLDDKLLLLDGTDEQRNLKTAWLEMINAKPNAAGQSDPNTENPIAQFRPSQSVVVCVEKFLYFMHYYSLSQNQSYYKCNVTVERSNPNNPSAFAPSSQRPGGMSQMRGRPPPHATQPADEWLSTRKAAFKLDPIKPNFDVVLNLWCMFPSVAFADAFAESRAVILASGTLCPTETLKTELGLKFSGEMEGTQVIDKTRIFATVLAEGPSGRRLNATYRNVAAGSEFLAELAQLIVRTCLVVPRGVLCFVSSYNVLQNLREAMDNCEDLNYALRARKVVFEEPRRSSNLQPTLNRYEEVIRHPERFGPECDGALMLAVFRGKVSEGIDFADDKARCVICVGIPYPNARNELVLQKKRFNDENASKANILGGDEWYTTQAYRALNQALGRCLRHKQDWGALLLVDERYVAKAHPRCSDSKKISRWVRDRLLIYSNYAKFHDALTEFVGGMREQDENDSGRRTKKLELKPEKKEPIPLIAII